MSENAWSYQYIIRDGNVIDLNVELIDGPYSHWRDENPGEEPTAWHDAGKLANTGDGSIWGIHIGPEDSIVEVIDALFP